MTALAAAGGGNQLDALSSAVSRLGGLVETQVVDAVNACARRDTALASAVIERDLKSDAAQRSIERMATGILASQAVAPIELREVMSAYKIAGELERVGDLAKSMSKRTLVLNEADPLNVTRGIERMGRIAIELLKHVLDAYAKKDVERALAVWKRDEELDVYYNSLFRELLTYMMEDQRTITPCAHLLFVAKNVERVGDHCTNIAESVYYLVTGDDAPRERPKAVEVDRWFGPASEDKAEQLP